MKPIDESKFVESEFDEIKVPLLEENDLVRGGEDGESNAPTIALTKRTGNLNARTKILEEWKKQLTDEDKDNIVNTITEMITMFKDMPENAGTILEQLGKKQDRFTIDGMPVSGSTNPVSSGGVFEELAKKVDKSSLPAGIITMWSGAIANIPTGWALCNGTNGTPDLRDRFIVGAGSSYNVGATGGEATHTLNANEMPTHSHGMSGAGGHSHQSSVGFASGGGGAQNGLTLTNNGKYEQYTFGSSWVGDHAHTISNAGGGQPHENRPPYYALAYIMKLPY